MAAMAGLALSGPGFADAPPGWTAYADCAAAYLANARVADANRPAAMIAQVSDVANDYEAAARARYRRQLKASPAAAAGAVHARIVGQTRIFELQPREAVERIIDACPQVGG